MAEGSRDFVRVLLAYFLPPVGVFFQVGFGMHFWLNLLLCLAFYVPAQVHAVWVIASIGPGGRAEPDGTSTFISLLLAAFLPPVGVFMKRGLGVDLVVNIVLCVLFWIPGMIHAAWVITKG